MHFEVRLLLFHYRLPNILLHCLALHWLGFSTTIILEEHILRGPIDFKELFSSPT